MEAVTVRPGKTDNSASLITFIPMYLKDTNSNKMWMKNMSR
jgi:hypothetical protein